ncbi:2-dehydro-3-deoxyphosphogluconate aldolase [Pandoraea vervacti]|uniref:2-dehydro-3-deoxy-phosphogluconate aldolase n=1 Tax=Pandoraea vervacti TaxID=656178 RepID=A0ABM5SVD2_9BURK|nr:bifunctional 4-hydroxy-2-oxoglutarate aldolase/2-dehydro-3-deoxy-phosphogluconate aldolase [Pandoraea vervacti]AJP56473.1 2-dehydro-3-deoxyphosphogluconate aldolase [Pandoraea vervacti]
MNINDIVRAGPVVPVLQFDNVEQGEQVSRALLAGGVRVLEITLRTSAAMDVIRHVAGLSDELIVGVGTLTRPEEMAQAVAAGARFGVSPGYTPTLGAAAKAAGLPLLPGVVTPSDILAALADGYETVKFFPAEPSGGVPMLKALYGPFRQMRFCPTGGISAESAPSYLAQPNVVCVGGSWLTPKALVDAKDWDGITRLARAASALPRA